MFNSLFRVCLIFYTYDSRTSKSIRNTMKKMLLILRWYNVQDVLNGRLFKTNRQQ